MKAAASETTLRKSRGRTAITRLKEVSNAFVSPADEQIRLHLHSAAGLEMAGDKASSWHDEHVLMLSYRIVS